jgi:hypothetical protein
VSSRLDLARLQDAREVAKLAERYVLAESEKAPAVPSTGVLGLFS